MTSRSLLPFPVTFNSPCSRLTSISVNWAHSESLIPVSRSTNIIALFLAPTKVALSHMQHENDKYSHQGKEYSFAGFDELTQFLEEQYLYIISRIRGTNPDVPLRIRATTNPGGIGHVWVKERFVDVAAPGETYVDPDSGLSRAFIPAKVTDNPALVDNDPGYIKRLQALPEVEGKGARQAKILAFPPPSDRRKSPDRGEEGLDQETSPDERSERLETSASERQEALASCLDALNTEDKEVRS